jgi:hypothetical protein
MRTTLTLDDDVAILLKRLSEERQVSFRTLVNEALREGLRQLEAPAPQPAFRTEPSPWGAVSWEIWMILRKCWPSPKGMPSDDPRRCQSPHLCLRR